MITLDQPDGYECLLMATRDVLRKEMQLREEECDLTDNGRPFPGSTGPWFISVHRGMRTNKERLSIAETLAVTVTVTRRIDVPTDNIASLVVYGDNGMQRIMSKIRAVVGRDVYDYTICREAQTLLGTATGTGPMYFTLGLQFLDDEEPWDAGPSWLYQDLSQGADVRAKVARLHFGGALLQQSFDQAY